MTRREIQAKLREQESLAAKLGEFRGEWVAVRGSTVVDHDATLDTLLRKIQGLEPGVVFQVLPADTTLMV